ncbi:MAG TPA: hypothetical protein VFW94_23685 [Candidatus Acidoferrales bacterium]|nr:hypothetical protein [Candidatus Acidoferrales bacterium]
MTADEIRSVELYAAALEGVTRNVQDCSFFLREIAAQLAEINQHLRSRQRKPVAAQKANAVRSMNRRTSHGKRFYVHHWQLQADPDMLREFEPDPGHAHPDDLEVNQFTMGTLGTISGAKITRVQ